ncbi:MAG TPA: type VI secretion system tube protein Hcp [Candidatus Saccharimonadales bacterium]|nr:type VI secretion system tube protein Hcp [Candidatus Saccharimonadales bacterium]
MRKINIAWHRFVPVLGVSLLTAGLVSFVNATPSSAHQRGDWDKDTRYFLKLDGITGSSTDAKHQGQIELNSYRLMEDEPEAPTDSGMHAELVKLGDNNLRFLADSSKASPELFAKAQSGDVIANAVLSVQKGGKSNDYLTVKLTNVVVTSYQNSGDDSNNGIDEVLVKYGTVQIEHNEGTPIKKGWDFFKKHEM